MKEGDAYHRDSTVAKFASSLPDEARAELDSDRLTQKQRLLRMRNRFVAEYTKDFNLTATAQRMGVQRADVYRLYARPNTKKLIEKRVQEMARKAGFTAEAMFRRLVENINADIGEAYDENSQLKPIGDWPPHLRRWVKRDKDGHPVPLDKTASLTALGKHFGLITENVKVSTVDPVEVLLNSLPPHMRPPGLERRGIRIWDETDAELVPQPVLAEGPTP